MRSSLALLLLLLGSGDGLRLPPGTPTDRVLSRVGALGRAGPPRASATPSAAQMQALPGDPSLVLHTSATLGDGKIAFMKAASKAIATALSKPELYVAVCVYDAVDIVWNGEETPCALGVLCSIGALNQANNAALTAAVSELLAPHGVPADRIYINFFDVPRENCGWSGRTFAG